MGWGRRYPREQQAAQHALLASATGISSALSNFIGWLLAVSGASFALLLSNIETVLPHVGAQSLKWAVGLFAASLLLGLVSRWLGASVAGSSAAMLAVLERAERTGPIPGFNRLAFTKLLTIGLMPMYRCFSWHSYKKSKSGELIPSLRGITYQSQAQAVLAMAVLLLLFASVVVLACGIKT